MDSWSVDLDHQLPRLLQVRVYVLTGMAGHSAWLIQSFVFLVDPMVTSLGCSPGSFTRMSCLKRSP